MYDPPVLSVTAGRRIFAATTGYMTYRTGEWSLLGWGGDASQKMDKSSVSLGMAGMNKHGNYSGELQVLLYMKFFLFHLYDINFLQKKRRVFFRLTLLENIHIN